MKARSDPSGPVHRIRVGRVEYSLKTPVIGFFQQGAQGAAFRVDEFLPHFIGQGSTPKEAFKQWCEHIHVLIQRLRAIPHSLRSKAEVEQWDLICRHVDIEKYDRTQPIKTWRRGIVTSCWPAAWRITWDNGSEEEISLDIMPDEFGAFETGDALEAALDQDPVTGKTLYVFSVRPIVPDESPSEDEEDEFWRSVTQTEDLPESERDWTK